MLGAKGWLMLAGAALVLTGLLIRWRVARYDLKDAAIDSAWTLARGRRTPDNPTALEVKIEAIRSRPTWFGKATGAAGTVAGHFVAQVLGTAALIMILAGLALGLSVFFVWD
jgi:hypothetical protein